MLSAAILAGGVARRFGGRDKSALVVDDRSILDRQVAELASLTDDILLVGGHERQGGEASWLRVGACVRVVPDRVPGCGPLGGLDTALAEARGETLLLVACDMPFVTAALLAHLAGLIVAGDAVVPHTDRGDHPLCAAYSRACRPAVIRRLADGRLAMRGLLEDLCVRRVMSHELAACGDPDRLLANVNTAEEYAHLAPRVESRQL